MAEQQNYIRERERIPTDRFGLLAQLPSLNAGTAEHLAVLLLGHTLAALLDHRTHIGCHLPVDYWSWALLRSGYKTGSSSRYGTIPDYPQVVPRRKTGREPSH